MAASDPPYLIIPIETKVRELDAKILQASVAVEAGFRVLIGEQNAILRRLASLPQGFYLDKSIARPKVAAFQRLIRLGYRPVAWCEEGLVYRNREAYLNERVAPGAFHAAAAFFAWGKVQAGDIRERIGNYGEKVHVTGHPRFDLLRPEFRAVYEPQAEALRQKYGRFLLINTNFGRYNHFFGKDRILELLRTRGAIRNAQDEAFFQGWVAFLGQVYDGFVDLAPRLARAFPDRTVILRPHPSERHDPWREVAAGVPNLHVTHEGNIIPWLLAAEASVQNSCTTGVEAALLKRPVFAYRPAKSDLYDSFLPNRVSVEATNFEELRDGIAATLRGDYAAPVATDPEVRADLDRYVGGLEGPLAADKIGDILRKLADGTSAPPPARIPRALDHAERALRRVARTVLAPFRTTQAYSRQKFDGLTLAEVQDRVAAYRAVTGRFSGVRLAQGPFETVLLG